MELTIRTLDPEDAAAAQALVERFHRSRVSLSYLRTILASARNVLLVAEVEAAPVGFVWAHWIDRLRLEERQLFLYEIEVAPEHRRRGIGTRLVRALLAQAASAGSDAFVLTNRSNPGAVAFFKGLGGVTKRGDDLLLAYPRGSAPTDA